MKKGIISLLFFAFAPVAMPQTENSVPEGEKPEESRISLSIYGEADLSARDYTGSRFYTQEGPADEKSVIGKIPSFGISLNYDITPKWTAIAEAEFVSGNGIQVDEISLTHKFCPAFAIRGGIFMHPIGHCNAGYSYTDYFTTGDPEGEYSLIPCPFTETGISFLGNFNCGISYQASVTTGLNPLSISPDRWIQTASSGFTSDEAYMSSPAFSLRIDNELIDGLTFGLGGYFCPDVAKNMPYHHDFKDFTTEQTGKTYHVPVALWFADAEYSNRYFTLRASYLQGHMGNSSSLSDFFNASIGNGASYEGLDYERGVIGKDVISYMGEMGFNLKNCLYPGCKNWPVLIPFIHYECYDPQMKVAKEISYLRAKCSKVQAWSFGMNWKPVDEVAVKFNYTTRRLGHGGTNNMNEFNLGLAYSLDLL